METTDAAAEAPAQPQVVFRGKKRKAYRQRPEAIDVTSGETLGSATPDVLSAATFSTTTATPSPALTDAKDTDSAADETELLVAEILRRRNARRARLGGVTFGAAEGLASRGGDAAADAMGNDELSLMIREEEHKMQDATAAAHQRFVHQTGLSQEVTDKHM